MSSQLTDIEGEEAELHQAIIDSLHIDIRRNTGPQPDQTHTSNDTSTDDKVSDDGHRTDTSALIQTLTQNNDLRLGNHFGPVNDPLGDSLIYIGVPPPSRNQTSGENAYMKKHFDKFFVLQSSALRALQSSTLDRLLGPNACIRAEKRFKKLDAYMELLASAKNRIKYHIDLRPPKEDDEAVLLITDLTCSQGILDWHRAETFFSLSANAIAGTDYFDGPSNPYYLNLKGVRRDVTELVNRHPAAAYCPVRHYSGLERLVNAIAGNDPKLDSAPKMWVFFVLARYLGCSQHDIIRKWIFAWLWQPNNHNFIQSNPEAAYHIGLGCQSQHLARDAFAILVGEKALVDVVDQLRGVVTPPLASVHGRPFEILDDVELNRIGHAATSLVRRIRSTLQGLICKGDWMNESSEFRQLLEVETRNPSQRRILLSACEALVDYVKYRLSTILVREFRHAHDIFHPGANTALPHKRYRLNLEDTYNQLPYLARPFTRSFWQTLCSIKLRGGGVENDSLVWQTISSVKDDLQTQDSIFGLGLTNLRFKSSVDVERKISMVNDTISAQETPTQFVFRPKIQEPAPFMLSSAPESPKKRHIMKRVSDEWVVEGERDSSLPEDIVPPSQDDLTSPPGGHQPIESALNSTGKRHNILGNQMTLEPIQYPSNTETSGDSKDLQRTLGFSTSVQSSTDLSSSRLGQNLSSNWHGSGSAPTLTASNQLIAHNLTNQIDLASDGMQKTSNTDAARLHAPAETLQTSTTIQPRKIPVLPIRQQPSSVPFVWQSFANEDAILKGPETTFSINENQVTKPHIHTSNPVVKTFAANVGPQAPQDSSYSIPKLSNPSRRPLQQLWNPNSGSSVRLDSPEGGSGTIIKNEHINLEHMLWEFEQIVHRRALDLVYPAHIFHHSSSLPVDTVDNVFCLNDDEWKYLPLTVGGLDDGSGGAFDAAVQNVEIGGFRGRERGIGNVDKLSSEFESETSSFDDIVSEAVGTVRKASNIATSGTETIKRYNESETDAGFDYINLYNEMRQLKVERAGFVDNAIEADGGAARRGDERDDSTFALSNSQGDYFGAHHWVDDIDSLAHTEAHIAGEVGVNSISVRTTYVVGTALKGLEDWLSASASPRLSMSPGSWKLGDPDEVELLQDNDASRYSASAILRIMVKQTAVVGTRTRIVLKTYTSRDSQQEFEAERAVAEALAHLPHHPDNLSKVLGHFDIHDLHCLVLENADWGSLDHYFRDAHIPLSENDEKHFYNALFCLSEGLKCLHSSLVGTKKVNGWHADIKPSNILLASDDTMPFGKRFLLSDFGNGAIVNNDGILRHHGNHEYLYPRLLYGAPELSNLDSAEDGQNCPATRENISRYQAADIWSLGTVFSEAVTWCMLGSPGLDKYYNNRLKETRNYSDAPRGCFHNNQQVLDCVLKWHSQYLRSLRAKHCTSAHAAACDSVWTNIIQHMLVGVSERPSADDICRYSQHHLPMKHPRNEVGGHAPLPPKEAVEDFFSIHAEILSAQGLSDPQVAAKLWRRDNNSYFDKFKLFCETYSGQSWIWYPFQSPRPALMPGASRLDWICPTCDEKAWLDVDGLAARFVQAAFHYQDEDKILHAPRRQPHYPMITFWPGQTQQIATTSKRSGTSGMNTPSTPTIAPSGSGTAGVASGPGARAQAVTRPTVAKLHVLLCTECWEQNSAGDIDVVDDATDDQFFAAFRSKYKQLRGWLLYNFSPWQLRSCDVALLRKSAANNINYVETGFPPHPHVPDYIYSPKPSTLPYKNPLCPGEWKGRIWNKVTTAQSRNKLEKLPRLTQSHELSTFTEPEHFYGLQTRLAPSGAIVVGYTVGILIVPVGFGVWWLLYVDSKDLQNASIPFMVVVTFMAGLLTLWIPLHSSFKEYS